MSAKIVCFGELLLRLGAPGRQCLLQSPNLDVHVGGAEANVAVMLARLGHPASMVSAVPANALGAAAVGQLRRHGVDTQAVATLPRGRMGLYFLESGAGHRPSQVLYDRAGSSFAERPPAEWDWHAGLSGASWLHLSGVTPALGSAAADAADAAIAAAERMNVRVSFDGNYRAALWQLWQGEPVRRLTHLIRGSELLFANQRDIDLLLGSAPAPSDPVECVVAAARRAFAAFPRLRRMASTIRIQRSVDHHLLSAVLVSSSGDVQQTAQVEISTVVDRIGTGDAFAAGVLHGLLDHQTDASALQLGLAAACLKHSIPGDFCLINRADLGDFTSNSGFDVRR
jgi:2-dehydro-3-deoxygluconokinase